jgi:uncharacterized metal-binding protein
MKMCYAIPIFANRVAPRCTIAEFVIFLITSGNKVVSRRRVTMKGNTWIDLIRLLGDNGADILICGGINRNNRELIESRGIMIIDNVCCSDDEVQAALESGELYSGYGFSKAGRTDSRPPTKKGAGQAEDKIRHSRANTSSPQKPINLESMDCLACQDKVCLQGQICRPGLRNHTAESDGTTRVILESSLDIISEKERTLCRLTELIYFCLEMKYKRIGIAFCIEMFEQTDLLARLLRRFFEVYPICCKIGGKGTYDPHTGQMQSDGSSDYTKIACNPVVQANMLNKIGTDINIIVGLCMGVDCVFTKASNAPVSTLFVKDKSLAHNPIGALYSDYYLKEIAGAKAGKTRPIEV